MTGGSEQGGRAGQEMRHVSWAQGLKNQVGCGQERVNTDVLTAILPKALTWHQGTWTAGRCLLPLTNKSGSLCLNYVSKKKKKCGALC